MRLLLASWSAKILSRLILAEESYFWGSSCRVIPSLSASQNFEFDSFWHEELCFYGSSYKITPRFLIGWDFELGSFRYKDLYFKGSSDGVTSRFLIGRDLKVGLFWYEEILSFCSSLLDWLKSWACSFWHKKLYFWGFSYRITSHFSVDQGLELVHPKYGFLCNLWPTRLECNKIYTFLPSQVHSEQQERGTQRQASSSPLVALLYQPY